MSRNKGIVAKKGMLIWNNRINPLEDCHWSAYKDENFFHIKTIVEGVDRER